MFTRAIEIAAAFTRPIRFIGRNYGSDVIHPGAASLFFVNADGWALTCGHVVAQLSAANELVSKRREFKAELTHLRGKAKHRVLLRELERRCGFSKDSTYELCYQFVDCIEGPLNLQAEVRRGVDVALIKFSGSDRLLCHSFPTFARDDAALKPGKFLCRLGFPFAEFTNYAYDHDADEMKWTPTGRVRSPRFPIEGMVTRGVVNEADELTAFEMSTPGLRGQSGGPAFDAEGIVWGMQSATYHLDLDFDVDQEVLRQGRKTHVKSSSFLHVGRCIHVSVLKSIMREKGVAFQEG